jgi:hypothetical protein
MEGVGGVLVMLGRILLRLLLLLEAVASCPNDGGGLPPICRRSFPKGFIFGTASSAYQVSAVLWAYKGLTDANELA